MIKKPSKSRKSDEMKSSDSYRNLQIEGVRKGASFAEESFNGYLALRY